MPYPTPIFDEDGNLRCAVNMLIDLSDRRQSELLRVQAAKCRWHARSIGDERAATALTKLAEEYDAKANDLDRLALSLIWARQRSRATYPKIFLRSHLRPLSTICISEVLDPVVGCRGIWP